MKIHFATDHAGFELKEELRKFVEENGFEITDHGAKTLNKDDDYPDYICKAAKAVSDNPQKERGIILGYSGQGEAIVANRFPNVRAAVYYGGNKEILKLSREHNDANILSLAAGFLSIDEAKEAVKYWLDTSFTGEDRHIRRIAKIDHAANLD